MGKNNREVQLLKGSRGEYVVTVAMRLDLQEQHPPGTDKLARSYTTLHRYR